MDLEIWKFIKGEVNYMISSLGRVKNVNTGKIRELTIGTNGYLQIKLDCKTYRVHRLVAETFLPEGFKDGFEVNHINEIITDNRLENLEWVSHKDNCNHGTRNERHSKFMIGNQYAKKNYAYNK